MLRRKLRPGSQFPESEVAPVEKNLFLSGSTGLPNTSNRQRDLEKLVLGDEKGFLAGAESDKTSVESSPSSSDSEEPDVLPIRSSSVTESCEDDASLKPAWFDEDDEKHKFGCGLLFRVPLPSDKKLKYLKYTTDKGEKISGKQYASRLKDCFQKAAGSVGTPSWASLERTNKQKRFKDSSDSEEEGNSELTKRARKYIGSQPYLPRHTLQFKRLQDVTFGRRKRKPVSSVEFHKNSKVALVGSQAQTVSLYEVDGESNPLLQNVTFERFQVDVAHFSADGTKVFVGSHLHSYFYYYDLLDGQVVKVPEIRGMEQTRTDCFDVSCDGKLLAFRSRFGYIHLLSAKSFEWVSTLKMNGEASRLVFSKADCSKMYSFGESCFYMSLYAPFATSLQMRGKSLEEGQVYIWDVARQHCIHKFFDDGCIQGSSIDVSRNSSSLATGSNTGVVNLYDAAEVEKSQEPKPLKTLMNLTTPVDNVKFSKNGEILAFASSLKDNSLRMAHTGSRTVYANFPGRAPGVKKVTCLDFSSNDAYVLAGNTEGRAMLFRLQHYNF